MSNKEMLKREEELLKEIERLSAEKDYLMSVLKKIANESGKIIELFQ